MTIIAEHLIILGVAIICFGYLWLRLYYDRDP